MSPTRFFYKQSFFSTEPHCCLTFSQIELQFLLRCSFIHITILKLRHILYLVYSCPCLGLGLFMSCLCDPFFFFSFIFIVINHINSLEYALLFLNDNVHEESEKLSNSNSLVSGCCLAFA